MKLDYTNIKKVYDLKGYQFYDGNKPFNVNIFGIRCAINSNMYDDLICVAYKDNELNTNVEIFQGTTDPGRYWLEHPMNSGGTATLVEGQYKSYKIDKHQGKYKAICQRRNKVKVYRDGNKDAIHDMEAESITEGYYGINIHKSSPYSTYVNKWSAGCQVFREERQFNRLMEIAEKSISIYGNKLTYTLFNKADFDQ